MPKKPVTDPHKAWNIQHYKRLEKYNKRIEKLLNDAIGQTALIVGRHEGKATEDHIFSFSDNRQMKAEADKLMRELAEEITQYTKGAETKEWETAYKQATDYIAELYNIVEQTQQRQELFLDRLLMMKSRNMDALESFQNRKIGGLKLSDKVWSYTKDFERQMETAIDTALLEGKSAAALSRDIRSLLKDPDALFRRVRGEDDQLRMSKAMEAYHPGHGSYRSAYKNAMRLARSEINMAYRASDSDTAQSLDCVVGIRVNLSNNHTCNGKPFVDICDELSDCDYPKDFKFTGWHPQCRCFITYITKTDEEFWRDLEDGVDRESVNTVDDVPDAFKEWVGKNEERIARAEERGTLPYFLRDNENYWSDNMTIPTKEEKRLTIQERAEIRHAARPVEEKKRILHDYDSYRLDKMRNSILDISIEGIGRIPDDMFYYVDEIETDIRNRKEHTIVRDKLNKLSSILTLYDKPQEGVLDYARGFTLRNDEITNLLFKAREASGTELETIKEQLVKKCAAATRSGLHELGYTKDLSFEGIARNFKIGYDYQWIENGNVINVKSYTMDFVRFKDKSGFEYYYPISSEKRDFLFNASEISKRMETFDSGSFIKQYTKGVVSVNKSHPNDAIYRERYPNFTRGAVYSFDPVTVHSRYYSVDDFLNALTHESAHHFDDSVFPHKSATIEWIEAAKKDKAFPTQYAKDTSIKDYVEDFADSVEEYYKNRTKFKNEFPNRAALLDEWL